MTDGANIAYHATTYEAAFQIVREGLKTRKDQGLDLMNGRFVIPHLNRAEEIRNDPNFPEHLRDNCIQMMEDEAETMAFHTYNFVFMDRTKNNYYGEVLVAIDITGLDIDTDGRGIGLTPDPIVHFGSICASRIIGIVDN